MNQKNRLRELRKERSWSLDEMVRRSGVSRDYIHRIETEGIMPGLKIANSLAKTLGVTVDYLFYLSHEHEGEETA